MFSERKIQSSQFASLNITTYDQFLQKSAHTPSSSTSFTVSFTLTVTTFSLKVQVEALEYIVPINSRVQNCTERTLEV